MSIQSNVPALAMEEVMDLLIRALNATAEIIVGDQINFNIYGFVHADCAFGGFRCSHVGS